MRFLSHGYSRHSVRLHRQRAQVPLQGRGAPKDCVEGPTMASASSMPGWPQYQVQAAWGIVGAAENNGKCGYTQDFQSYHQRMRAGNLLLRGPVPNEGTTSHLVARRMRTVTAEYRVASRRMDKKELLESAEDGSVEELGGDKETSPLPRNGPHGGAVAGAECPWVSASQLQAKRATLRTRLLRTRPPGSKPATPRAGSPGAETRGMA